MLTFTVPPKVAKSRYANSTLRYASIIGTEPSSMTMMMRSTLPRLARRAACQQSRTISVGTDMKSSNISLQKARPWYRCDDAGSNKAVDNAVPLKELFENRTVAVFGVPAPFTGTCTHEHYPGYNKFADDILSSGCDEIICYSVADPYAHDGWQNSLGNDTSKITFLADPDSSFAKTYGVDAKYDDTSLGDRSIRFSMLVVDGEVFAFRHVKDAKADAETLLGELKMIKEEEKVA